MERIVEVNGKNLVIGLEWSKLTGSNPVEAAKKISQSRKSPMGLLWSVSVDDADDSGQDSASQISHSVGLSHTKFKGAVYSAAAALARSHVSVIGIERIDDDLYWMAVTENGRVLPGYDAVTSEAEVKKKLQELAIDTQLDYMQFFMAPEVAEVFGIEDAYDQSPLSLILANGVDESMRLKKMAGIPKTAFMGVGIVLAGSVLFGFVKYQEIQKQKELEALMAEETVNLEEIEKEITVDKVIEKGPTDADILRQARQEEISWLRDDFNKASLLPVMKHVLLTVSATPTYFNGWSLDGVQYSTENPTQLSVVWKRNGGSPDSLKSFMGGFGRTGFTPSFDRGSTSIKIDPGQPGIEDVLAIIRDRGVKHQDFASALIEASVSFDSSIGENSARKQTISGLKDRTLENMPQLEVGNRVFKLSGGEAESFANLMDVMQDANNFLLEKINFTIQQDGTYNWELSGKLYE